MKKYEAKPVHVEAMCLDPDWENAREIRDWVNCPNVKYGTRSTFAGAYGGTSSTPYHPPSLEVETYNGRKKVKPGQWVVKQPNGKFSVLPANIFHERYGEVAE